MSKFNKKLGALKGQRRQKLKEELQKTRRLATQSTNQMDPTPETAGE